jgi:hypothetical protein
MCLYIAEGGAGQSCLYIAQCGVGQLCLYIAQSGAGQLCLYISQRLRETTMTIAMDIIDLYRASRFEEVFMDCLTLKMKLLRFLETSGTARDIPTAHPTTAGGIPTAHPMTARGIPTAHPTIARGIPTAHPTSARGIPTSLMLYLSRCNLCS